MATVSGELCTANGIDVHYLRTGRSGCPVVLLHGLMGNSACWTPVARVLAGDFDIVMPDARGHGGSSAPSAGYRYDDHADDVEGLIRELKLSRPVLVGHSMGGMTAALVAARGAENLRGVVLVDPTFLTAARQREVRDSDVAEQHRQALNLSKTDLVEQARARHPRRSSELLEIQAEARLQTRMGAFDVLSEPAPDYRDVVSAIDVPALLVIGDSSPVVTLDMATELQTLNPRLRLEQIQDAGHGLPFEQPERLGELLVAFLRELPSAGE